MRLEDIEVGKRYIVKKDLQIPERSQRYWDLSEFEEEIRELGKLRYVTVGCKHDPSGAGKYFIGLGIEQTHVEGIGMTIFPEWLRSEYVDPEEVAKPKHKVLSMMSNDGSVLVEGCGEGLFKVTSGHNHQQIDLDLGMAEAILDMIQQLGEE